MSFLQPPDRIAVMDIEKKLAFQLGSWTVSHDHTEPLTDSELYQILKESTASKMHDIYISRMISKFLRVGYLVRNEKGRLVQP